MRKWLVGLVALAVVVAVFVIWQDSTGFEETKIPADNSQIQDNLKAKLDRVIIIVNENRSYSDIIGNDDAPYTNKLANEYSLATNFYASFRPSLPNYMAIIGGSNNGIKSNCDPGPGCQTNAESIIDSIEAHNLTWKAYMEDMPEPCYEKDQNNYAVRHNPFMYYTRVRANETGCPEHVVPFTQFEKDLANGLPNYVFITPNLCNDTHDCGVKKGDDWLAKWVPRILKSTSIPKEGVDIPFSDRQGTGSAPSPKTLIVVTWDEAGKGDHSNRIPTILAGPAAKKNYKSNRVYTHYSLLKTIEQAWGLPYLTTNDRNATTMTEFLAN